MPSLLRKRSLKLDANQARTRHQIVPVVTNVRPRTMKAATFIFDAGSMNCGRKARKKSATFGLRTFVKTPCRNAATVVRRRLDGRVNSRRRSRIILIPRKARYAPPSNLIATNANADVARIAESPSAAAQV